jgi:hypothetical protein
MNRATRLSGVSGRLVGLAALLWACVPLACSSSKPLGTAGSGGSLGAGGAAVIQSGGSAGRTVSAGATGGSVSPSSGGAAGAGVTGTGGTAGMGGRGGSQGGAGADAEGIDSSVDSSFDGQSCFPIDANCSFGSVLDPYGCLVCKSDADIDVGSQGKGGSTGDVRALGATGGAGGTSTKNDGGGVTGIPCGRVFCAANEECCNPLCDMCVRAGGGCAMGCGEWGSLDVIGPMP